MARTVSVTTAEVEALLGPRGQLTVNKDNRILVRKWLNAMGFPSIFSGGRTLAELELSYNDTSGRALEALRQKMEQVGGLTADEATEAAEGTFGDFIITPAAHGQQNGADTAERIGGVKGATVAGSNNAAAPASSIASAIANAFPASTPTNRPGTHQSPPTATAAPTSTGPDMGRIIAAVTAAMQAMGDNMDVDAVRRIASEVVQAEAITKDEVQHVIRQIVHEIEGNVRRIEESLSRNAIRIEVKEGDTVRELDGIHHPQFAKLLKAASARQSDGHHPNIWIAGPAGSGKTYAAKTVAEALDAEFHYNGAISMPHELLGFIDAGGTYHETPFRKAYTSKAVYLFDEVDGSDNSALLALNAALANGRASFPNGQSERHADSIIIATANTWGLGATADYVGRAKIDAAFLSRFPVRINWDYDEDMEKQICGNARWAERVQKARKKARAAGIKVLIDPRATIAGAALIANGVTMDEAADWTFLANLTPEQRQMVAA